MRETDHFSFAIGSFGNRGSEFNLEVAAYEERKLKLNYEQWEPRLQ